MSTRSACNNTVVSSSTQASTRSKKSAFMDKTDAVNTRPENQLNFTGGTDNLRTYCVRMYVCTRVHIVCTYVRMYVCAHQMSVNTSASLLMYVQGLDHIIMSADSSAGLATNLTPTVVSLVLQMFFTFSFAIVQFR